MKSFEQWLGAGSRIHHTVYALPLVLERALVIDFALPVLPTVSVVGTVHEADGLEWPLRLAALWQLLKKGAIRQTQVGEFFKRDLDRLRLDPVLNAPPSQNLVDLPDPGLLAVALGQVTGVLQMNAAEVKSGCLPAAWQGDPTAALRSLWEAVPLIENWNPQDGWCSVSGASPYASAYLLSLLLLLAAPDASFVSPAEIEGWMLQHHPFWAGQKRRSGQEPIGVATFLLGFAYQLRMLQAAKDSAGQWCLRLSPYGRWLLNAGAQPASDPPFAQTLVVQPNLEILAYRQGLTPDLIVRLSQFASWKTLGSACTLDLEPDMVYLALESGFTFEAMVHLLEQHGTRPPPTAVIESLRTWAGKRERISVYSGATLFEFASADDVSEAFARGLKGTRLSEYLVAVSSGEEVDFRHFRLTGTRDYSLPPEKCVNIEEDGVTLVIDDARSDLLLQTELERFARQVEGSDGRTRYRVTPASVSEWRDNGLAVADLEEWFAHRTRNDLPPAIRLLLNGGKASPLAVRRQLVLHVDTEETADGLMQWPDTKTLISSRLGPTALVVDERELAILCEKLKAIGLHVKQEKPDSALNSTTCP
jgi:hypothetical protein